MATRQPTDKYNDPSYGTALPEGFEQSLQPDLSGLEQQQQLVSQQLEAQTQQFDQLQAKVDSQFLETQTALNNYNAQIQAGLEKNSTATQDIIEPFQKALQGQLNNMRNAYDVQLTQQAKQLDSLVGQGAFGGNSYRAQQAYASTMQQLTAQSLGQMSEYVVNSEKAILDARMSLNSQTEAQRLEYVKLLGTSASMTMQAASVYTRDSLGILSGKTSATNTLLGLQTSLQVKQVELKQRASEVIANAQMQVLGTRASLRQAQIAADAQKYSSKQAAKAAQYGADMQYLVSQMQYDTMKDIARIEAQSNDYRSDAMRYQADLEAQTQANELASVQPAIDALTKQFKM